MKFLALIVLLLLTACSGPAVLSDREYFENASKAMEDEDFQFAVTQYQTLMEEYPFSEYSEEAQLKVAYAQYRAGQYAEAIASFEDFQRMHPTSPNLPFAEFYLAMAYMDQMNDKHRDQSASAQALAHFERLIDRYPESPFADQAREKLRECRVALAEHELTVAEFYLHWSNPIGAEARLRYMISEYPDTETTARALERFGDHFQDNGDLTRAALAYAAVVQEYPDSSVAEDAREELQDLAGSGIEAETKPLARLRETLGRPVTVLPDEPPATLDGKVELGSAPTAALEGGNPNPLDRNPLDRVD